MRRVVEIALFTDAPDRLTAFYERLLDGPPAQRWPSGAIFELGDLTLLVHRAGPPGPHAPANRDHIAIGAADVDAAADLLRAAGVAVDGPADYNWGRSAYLHDPDGRMLELHRPRQD